MPFDEKQISKEKIEEMREVALAHRNGRELRRVKMIAEFDNIV